MPPIQTLTIDWKGTFVELCLGRVSPSQRKAISVHPPDLETEAQTVWYDNTDLLKSIFKADNWWSVDDLDHAMGLVFADRDALDRQLMRIAYTIDGRPVTVDPDALQLSIYAPEALPPLDEDERIICHGTRREATLHLKAEFSPPFDPSLITLSLLRYPDIGYVLIDVDYDGHDEIQFTWGATDYMKPQFFGRNHFNDTAS